MDRLLPNLPAILTACATVLAGIPLFGSAPPRDPGEGCCVVATPNASAPESRGEKAEEEREEEQERSDAEFDFFITPSGTVVRAPDPSGVTDPDTPPAAAIAAGAACSIRGPPAG